MAQVAAHQRKWIKWKWFGIEAAYKILSFKCVGGDIWYNLIYENVLSRFWLESLKKKKKKK